MICNACFEDRECKGGLCEQCREKGEKIKKRGYWIANPDYIVTLERRKEQR